ARTFSLAAEFETTLANRVMWYEARVRWIKEVEAVLFAYVQKGSFAPHWFNVVRFYRLGAEAELVELLADVKWFGAAVPPPMVPPQPPGEIVARKAEPSRSGPL